MRIVKILSQPGQTVGKSPILSFFISRRHLHIGCHHPADGGSHFYAVAESREHPRPVSPHGASHASYPLLIYIRKSSHELGGSDIIIMHESAEVTSEHHHITGYDIIFGAVHALFPAPFAPQRRIGREAHISMSCQIVAHILSAVQVVHPFVGIVDDLLLHPEGPYHFFFPNEEMGTMVVQQIDSGERPLAVGHQHIGHHTRIGIDIEHHLQGLIPLALFLAHHLHVITLRFLGRCHHTLERFRPCRLPPLVEVGDAGMVPSQRIGKFFFQLLHIDGEVERVFKLLPFLERGFLLCMTVERGKSTPYCDDE